MSKDLKIPNFRKTTEKDLTAGNSPLNKGNFTTRKKFPILYQNLPYSIFGNILVKLETNPKILINHDSWVLKDDFFFRIKKSKNKLPSSKNSTKLIAL